MQSTPTMISSLLSQLNTVMAGKSLQVRDCVTCLLAGGHLLRPLLRSSRAQLQAYAAHLKATGAPVKAGDVTPKAG